VRVRDQRSAVLIGAISGVLVVEAALFIEKKLKLDDPVGAIAVHGVNGAWGVLSLGLFADGSYGDGWNGVPGTVKGLFYGDPRPVLAASHRHGLTCIVFVFVSFYVFFRDRRGDDGNRVSPEGRARGPGHARNGCHWVPGLRTDSGIRASRILICLVRGDR
jgi:Amt family ammonium transporter